jgi:2,4-dienoyl-CoA reductase-like NADH-dependent reductase (Old Yellow Enzyme family)
MSDGIGSGAASEAASGGASAGVTGATGLDVLWRPLDIGATRVRNRVFIAGHTTNLGSENLATDRNVAYHRARARGGVGLIITEALRVHPTAAARDRTLGVFDDACVPGLAKVAHAVHAEGAAIFGQIMHIGRQANGALARTAAWGASPEPWSVGAAVPHEMGPHEISLLIDAFAAGARRVLAADFDGLEVHLGHGHLLAQFLSPAVNRRMDGYGGSRAGRLRLAREVLERVLSVADGRTVGVRISAEEFLDGGIDTDAAIGILGDLLEDLPIDFLHVSHAAYVGKYSLSTQIADMTFEAAEFRSLPAAIKEAFPDRNVFAVCRLDTIEMAASIIAAGEADMAGLTRAHIADPDLVAKARGDLPQPVRHCIACNQACIGRIEHDLPMSCVVNPEVGFEGEWEEWLAARPLPAPRRVLVVGGGPTGLQAALSARRRGHDVELVEARDVLGGQIRHAATLAHRERFGLLVDDLEVAARQVGVRVSLGVAASPELVRDGGFDAVVVATGSRPRPRAGYTDVWSAIDDPDALGSHVVVLDEDGSWAGAGTALHLAERGATVHLVAPVAGLAWNVSVYVRLSLAPLLGAAGVRVRPLRDVRVDEDGTTWLKDVLTGELERLDGVTGLVHVGPRDAVAGIEGELREAGVVVDVVVAGDAYAPRTAFEAVYEGALAGVLAGGEEPPLLTDEGLPPYRVSTGTAFH